MANNTLYEHPTNFDTFTGMLLKYPNEVLLSGMLAEFILGALFVIVFGSLAAQGTKRAFAAAAFIDFIVATMLVALGVAGQLEWAFTVVLLVVAMVINDGDIR